MRMKTLLTGEPHSGKTTLLHKLLADVENKQGFVTQEIPGLENPGKRLGFDLVGADGHTALLAHITSPSTVRVSRYGVNVTNLDTFIDPLFSFVPDQLLYIDEIGQMELYSTKFRDLVELYIQSPNDFIGTITSVYNDRFVDRLKNDSKIRFITITSQNRDDLYEELRAQF